MKPHKGRCGATAAQFPETRGAVAPSGQNAAAISEQLVNGTPRYTADVSVDPGTDLSVHTVQDLKRVQDSLNNRPHPTLDLATPKQKFNELLLAAAA